MKKKFENPKLNISKFLLENILTTSSAATNVSLANSAAEEKIASSGKQSVGIGTWKLTW